MEKQQKPRLINWTKKKKKLLLEALSNYGSHNVSLFSDSIIGKDEKEINAAIQFYREKGYSSSLKRNSEQEHERNIQPSTPLDSWANFLLNSYGLEDLQTEIATAFRLIAYFESKPPAACTENIDFKKVYLMMADAIEGKTIPNDTSIKCLLDKCIKETALISKALIRKTKYKNIIKSINGTEREMTSFSKPTNNMELATIRHVLNQNNYNPLHLTEDYLIPSAQP